MNVKFANFVWFCITRGKSLALFENVVTLFRAQYKSIQNSQTSHDCIFHILRYFSTKLHNFTKFMMLFPAVLMNFSNSKVCLIGEWSISVGGRGKHVCCPLPTLATRIEVCYHSLFYTISDCSAFW